MQFKRKFYTWLIESLDVKFAETEPTGYKGTQSKLQSFFAFALVALNHHCCHIPHVK